MPPPLDTAATSLLILSHSLLRFLLLTNTLQVITGSLILSCINKRTCKISPRSIFCLYLSQASITASSLKPHEWNYCLEEKAVVWFWPWSSPSRRLLKAVLTSHWHKTWLRWRVSSWVLWRSKLTSITTGDDKFPIMADDGKGDFDDLGVYF